MFIVGAVEQPERLIGSGSYEVAVVAKATPGIVVLPETDPLRVLSSSFPLFAALEAEMIVALDRQIALAGHTMQQGIRQNDRRGDAVFLSLADRYMGKASQIGDLGFFVDLFQRRLQRARLPGAPQEGSDL